MKKYLPITIVLILATTYQARAQWKGFSFGPFIELGKPRGDLADRNGTGIGVGVAADIKLASKWAVTGSFGYMRFGRKGGLFEDSPGPLSATPIRAGVKYKLPLIYVKLESGMARYNKGVPSALIFSPGAGVRILGLDIQGSYESWLGQEGWSYASIRLGYHF